MSALMSQGRTRRRAFAGLLVAGGVAAILFALSVGSLSRDAAGLQPVADFEFEVANGTVVHLSDFRGRTVLLNLWATWCAPCRAEMPMLDRLQAQLGGPEFELVAVAVDRGGMPAVQRFFNENGIANLAAYVGDPGNVMGVLGVVGLPTTLLIDAEGREVFRVIGPARWDSPEMVARVQAQLASADLPSIGGSP